MKKMELLEYVVAVLGTLGLFYYTKATNIPVRNFPVYLLMLTAWGFILLLFLRWSASKQRENKK